MMAAFARTPWRLLAGLGFGRGRLHHAHRLRTHATTTTRSCGGGGGGGGGGTAQPSGGGEAGGCAVHGRGSLCRHGMAAEAGFGGAGFESVFEVDTNRVRFGPGALREVGSAARRVYVARPLPTPLEPLCARTREALRSVGTVACAGSPPLRMPLSLPLHLSQSLCLPLHRSFCLCLSDSLSPCLICLSTHTYTHTHTVHTTYATHTTYTTHMYAHHHHHHHCCCCCHRCHHRAAAATVIVPASCTVLPA